MTIRQQVMRKLGTNDLEKAIAVRNEAYRLHLIAQEDVQREKSRVVVQQLEPAIKWADQCASHAEEQAKSTRFITIQKASESDAKQFRKLSTNLRKVLATVKDDKGGR
jgi:hypothetical protein